MRIVGFQFVAGQLLADETVVGQIVVEGADYIIAILVGIGTEIVFFEAFGFAVADQIEPVLSPVFAVARRGQQAIDHFDVSVGRLIGEKVGLLLRRGRQAGEIECHPPQQR